MHADQVGLLEKILTQLDATLKTGMGDLMPVILGYVALFSLLALVLVCYGLLWNGKVLPTAFGLLIRLALVTFAINKWPFFLGGLAQIATQLGLLVTGSHLDIADFLDPGSLIRMGVSSAAPMWQAFRTNLGWTSFVTGFAYLLAYILYVTSFIIMAHKTFWWQAELALASVAGVCLLPTLAFRPTQFVTSGLLSYSANAFCRFLIGALLAGALWRHLETLMALARPVGAPSLAALDITLQEAFFVTVLAGVMAACFLSVNRIAAAITSGVPGMAGGGSVGSLIRTVAGAATALATGGAAATTAALGAGSVVAGGVQGAVGAVRSTGDAMRMLTSGGGEAHRLGEAARTLYAGTRDAASSGAQARLRQLMGHTADFTAKSSQQSLQQLMGARRNGGQDQAHGGVRH